MTFQLASLATADEGS